MFHGCNSEGLLDPYLASSFWDLPLHPYRCPILSLTLFYIMSPKFPKIRAGVGAVTLVMSEFVHPSKPISDNYSNWPKNHKLQIYFWWRLKRKSCGEVPI